MSDADVEKLGFVLLIEVGIHNPSPPVISKSAKNIAKKFPSWTKIYEDSVDQATPELATPISTGIKFINSLMGEYPENFQKQLNQYELNRFITSADVRQIPWLFSTTEIPASITSVKGDGVELSRLSSLSELYESRVTDYVFYYSALNKEILTTKEYGSLLVDNQSKDQNPVQVFNWFDEFGLRVGLGRLYLESNEDYRSRILDTYINLPGISKQALQLTLRRELDIWRAYGSTPDSNYLGATPEIIEMSDIEMTTPYFSFAGNYQNEFKKFVEELNEKYPVNWGYAKWNNAYWDYAGSRQEGVGRLSASYDDATPLGQYYQPGVGDLSDGKLIVLEPLDATIDVDGSFKASGYKKTGVKDSYNPIRIDYEYYGSYYRKTYDNPDATVNFRYAVEMPQHGSYATPTVFYTDITFHPSNEFGPNSSASPEYKLIKITNADGLTLSTYEFKNLNDNLPYLDDSSTPYKYSINTYNATKIAATPLAGSGDFVLRFNYATPTYSTSVGQAISLASPNIDFISSDILVSSKLYSEVTEVGNTAKIPGIVYLNSIVDNDSKEDVILDKSFIESTILFPTDATPNYIHIDVLQTTGYDEYDSDVYLAPSYDGYGGLSYDLSKEKTYLIPSSPNIIASFINPNFATPDQHFGYIDTTGSSTANYYFVNLKYPYSSTPDLINISTGLTSTPVYPFKTDVWEEFSYTSTPIISGSINKYGVVITDPDNMDETFSKNNDVIGIYNLNRNTFGISYEEKEDYIVKKIEVVNNGQNSILYMDSYNVIDEANASGTKDHNPIIESYSSATQNYVYENLVVKAQYLDDYRSLIHSGWYSQDQEEYYIYVDPVVETHVTPGYFINLSNVARQGAPILIEIDQATPLTEVAFYDEDNPATPTIRNTEIVYANKSANLYLGYENVYDLDVVDTVTNYIIAQNQSTLTNEFTAFSDATPSIEGRGYEASYKVVNSFVANNDYWDQNQQKYVTRIELDSTPNYNVSYYVTYESSLFGQATPVNLQVSPEDLWNTEGFVYLSHNNYAFNTAEVNISPGYLLDDSLDYMVISVVSLDVNGNPKPYQSFRITSPYLNPVSEYITTDINGFAATRATYSGAYPSSTPGSYLSVVGLASSNPNAHENSESESFSKTYNFDIITNYVEPVNLKATAHNLIVEADGVSTNVVSGILRDGATPSLGKVIYWRKGRTLYDIFAATPYSNYVLSNSQTGRYSIPPFTAEDDTNPGYWLVAVETENASTPNANPVTIAGDIAYWYEKYNVEKYTLQGSDLPNNLLFDDIGIVPMHSTPSFMVNHHDGSDATPHTATPNWTVPKWFPISRYEQYQMQKFGDQARIITTYDYLNNEYEED